MTLVPYNLASLAEDDTIGGGKNIVAGASVNITKVSGGSAQIYSDEAGTTLITLPTVTDAHGELLVFIEPGDYNFSINSKVYRVRISGSLTAPTFASLATTPSFPGQIIRTMGHTNPGIGGQTFQDFSGSITNDTGSQITNTVTTGRYWKAIDPQRTPYEFGYIDGGVDASAAINACTAAWGECWLDKGKTYDIQYTVLARSLQCRGGVATLNCTSPTANTRFGSIGAAVMASPNAYGVTTNTGVLKGVDLQGFIIECNKLIGATGSTGLKGVYQYRCENFYNRNITVRNSASYSFWDHDDATTGTLYCSGTRDDCWAIDGAVSFEQVNVRGVTLNNCNAYTSTATLGYAPECQFHAYGGSDMRIVYNNCTGIADGNCPAIVSLAMEAKNIAMNDSRFINNYNGGASIMAALYMEGVGGNFGNINAKNCTFTSQYSLAVVMTIGASGSASAKFDFSECTIQGIAAGVTINGTGGIYEFANCAVGATASGATVPYAYYNNGAPTRFKAIGGSAIVSGGTAPVFPSNIAASNFTSVYCSPNASTLPVIKQHVVGKGTLLNGGDNANYLINMTESIVSFDKCSCVAIVDSSGMSTANAAAAAIPFSFFYLNATQVRVYTAQANNGKVVKFDIKEYF